MADAKKQGEGRLQVSVGAKANHRETVTRGFVAGVASALVLPWLIVLSTAFALAATVVLFDRTEPAGVTGLWLGSLVAFFLVSFLWWTRPRVENRRLVPARYGAVSMILVTLPVLLACIALVVAAYQSDTVHGFLYYRFYYGRLLTQSYWPVLLLAAAFYGGTLVSIARRFLQQVGHGTRLSAAFRSTLAQLPSLLPWGVAAIGLLLAAASLTMINVNFWRYWATADGWVNLAHYPVTLSDAAQVQQGGVSLYFVSFPLLPSLLALSFRVVGHDTLGAFLPIIASGVLLPVAVFLAAREMTENSVLAFLTAAAVAAMPMLRGFTVDSGEADGLLMAAVVFAAYLRVRVDSRPSGWFLEFVAGIVAGLASLARPEGILYMAAMFAAAFVTRHRHRSFWISLLGWLLVVGAFSATSFVEFGMSWPGNHLATLKIANFTDTIDALRGYGIFSYYTEALGVDSPTLVAILVGILVTILVASLWMLGRSFELVWMPVAALGNVAMVFLVGPIPAEATKHHDFFRHISYGLPLLALTVAWLLSRLGRRLRHRWGSWVKLVAVLGLSAMVMAELALLDGPVAPPDPARTAIMTRDVHVTAVQLLVDRYSLPTVRFRQQDSHYVPDLQEYMAVYPDDVNRHYAPFDVRRYDNAHDYYLAAMGLFLGFLALALLSLLSSWHEDVSINARLRSLGP